MVETAQQKSQASPKKRGKPRRPTLFEAYRGGMLNEDTLRELSDKIDRINDDLPASSTNPDTASPRGEPDGISHGTTSGEPHDIPNGQPGVSLVAQPVIAPRGEPDGIPVTSPDDSSPVSPRGESSGETILLTENQALLYECLKYLDGQFVTLPRIARALRASVDTLRSCIRKLRKVRLIHWSVENISGQNGMRITVSTSAYTLRGNKVSLHDKLVGIDYTQLGIVQVPPSEFHQVLHQMHQQASYQMVHQTNDQICSSSKKQLLQGLILENAFVHLNPQSLLPHLVHVETTEALQEFLDMANACISAGNTGEASPIKNPQGFLIAQLKAGYINPPEGYKSRRVRAQEVRNLQLEEELAALQCLKERQEELRFALFKAELTEDDMVRLEREAKKQINPKIGMSTERQIEVYKEDILMQWFTRQETP
jgi:hypothetical protein